MNNVIRKLLELRDKRDWKQFHSPENLAKSLVLEAAEVLEIFQWQQKSAELSEKQRKKLKTELADVYNWVLLLAHDSGIDIEKAALEKIKKNEKKYPVSKSKGNAKKYTEL